MNKLKFVNVKYKNIMSVGNELLELNLDGFNKTLITGKNGSAKSTILEAINFALFDRPFRNIKMGQLINSTNGKNLYVELELINGKDHVIIKRGQKPSLFEVTVNGELFEEESTKARTQENLENYLGINSIAFRQIVVLGTAGYTPFMELKTPERRKLVEDMLDLAIIAKMDKLNKEYIRNINQNIEVSNLKKTHQESMLTTHINFNKQQEENRKLINENYKNDISKLQEQRNDFIENVKSIKSDIDKIDVPDSAITNNKIEAINEKLNKLRDVKSKLGYELNDINKLQNLKGGGSCPLCKSDVSHIHDNSERINEIETQLGKINLAMAGLETEKNNISSLYTKQTNAKLALENKMNGVIDKIKSIDNAIKIKQDAIDNPQDLVDNSKEISEIKIVLGELDKELSKLTLEKYNRSLVTDLLKDSGVKADLIGYYIPYLNSRINHYLGMLEADYNFMLDSEFNEKIKSVGRENFTYHSFSQGEKARIDIAMLFAWKDVASKVSGTSINMLLLDEVFDGPSDSDCTKNIMKILNGLEDTNVFIISHADHDPQKYDRHVEMKKIGRFSQMTVNV